MVMWEWGVAAVGGGGVAAVSRVGGGMMVGLGMSGGGGIMPPMSGSLTRRYL